MFLRKINHEAVRHDEAMDKTEADSDEEYSREIDQTDRQKPEPVDQSEKDTGDQMNEGTRSECVAFGSRKKGADCEDHVDLVAAAEPAEDSHCVGHRQGPCGSGEKRAE